MEVVRTVGSVAGCINKLVNLIEKHKKRARDLTGGLKSMKADFDIIMDVRLEKEKQKLQLTPGMQLQLQELAYDIDDFVQGLWVPGPCGSFVLTATGWDSRPLLIDRIKDFKERIKSLKDELPKGFEPAAIGGTSTPAGSSSSAGSQISYAQELDLVGIKGPKLEIQELLSQGVEPHGGRLSVISIMGCSGSGKTALARALYQDDAVTKDFHYKAWVVASDHNPADILSKIRQQVVPTSALGSNSEDDSEHFQKNKRYLVFVDDVQRVASWKDISNAFRENVMDSKIIVTTSVPSVARARSSGSYMYTMKGLDIENSRRLFWAKFWQDDGYTAEDEVGFRNNDNVDIIVNKCDGLPMALISAAKYLREKGPDPTIENLMQVSQELRDCLTCCETTSEDFSAFAEMRKALVEPYEKLKHGEKECLLYVSIFSHGHQTTTKSLVRRLIAEGLVPRDDDVIKDSESVVGDVRECLRKLMDHSLIEPIPLRNYTNVAKRCRVHSIMLEFTIKKAVSRNFVSLIHEEKALRSKTGKVRRLTVQSSPDVRTGHPEKMDLSVLRSLAIFKSGIVDFEECKLVRVLNLQGCHQLTREDLDKISGLLFLKYLSLRNTNIQELPDNVKELKFLETLDTRDTGVKKLPVEVIMLPRFAYLFGKFELTNVDSKNTKKLTKFFSEKDSQLHTFGAISVDKTKDFDIILLVVQHARELKKVKLWYKNTVVQPVEVIMLPLAETLESTIKKRPIKCMHLKSVSIDFNGVPNSFLGFLRTFGNIGSIKLRKGSGNIPMIEDLQQIRDLKKLHLFSTGLRSEQLGALQHLQCLQYLKLSEDRNELWNSVFHVKAGGFKSLIWLCFEASDTNSKHPPVLIDEGVKTPLASLQLLCKGGPHEGTGEPLGVVGISRLAKLNEVILHHSAPDDAVEVWKQAAEGHINRPYVEKAKAPIVPEVLQV